MVKSALLAAFLVAGLVGCAHGPDGTVGTAGAASVAGDKFTKVWTVMGDRVTNGVHLVDGQFGWRMRSFVDKTTGARSHQLYVDVTYSGSWRFYNVASDETATDLEVAQIDREVGDCSNTLFGCDLNETVGVDLPEPSLRAHAQTGYQIQLRSKSGNSQILVVTKEQIQQQFLKVDQLAAGQSMTGASPLTLQTGPSSPPPAGGRKLGVRSVATPSVMAPMLGVSSHQGMWVIGVDDGSAAAKAGIEKGDVIIAVNDVPVNDVDGILAAVKAAPEGRPLSIALVHARTPGTVTVPF
jgi:hypothetical protein